MPFAGRSHAEPEKNLVRSLRLLSCRAVAVMLPRLGMWLVSNLSRLGDSPARMSRSRICATANEGWWPGDLEGKSYN
jgi:hypothetical protein